MAGSPRLTVNEQQSHVDPVAVGRVRSYCISLPGTTEKEAWGDPSFRVNGRMYAIMKFGRGTKLWAAGPPGAQETLLDSDPGRFFKPSNHPLHDGWVGMHLDDNPVDWETVEFLLTQAHAEVAGRRTGGKQ